MPRRKECWPVGIRKGLTPEGVSYSDGILGAESGIRMLGIQSGDNVAGDGFAAADGVDALVGLGLEVNLFGGDAEGFRDSISHFRKIGTELGAFENDHNIDVFDLEGVLVEKLTRVLEEEKAVGALPPGVGIGKMRADVAKPGSAEERVAESVGHDVAIGVADGSLVEGDFDAADNELAAFGETVKVVANAATNAHDFLCSRCR